jgi:ATP-binding cassette subfamily B protein
MRSGSFTVGDFTLFVYYLNFVTEFTYGAGQFMAYYQQSGVAFARMVGLLGGAAPTALVAHTPPHLRGPLPAAAATAVRRRTARTLAVRD